MQPLHSPTTHIISSKGGKGKIYTLIEGEVKKEFGMKKKTPGNNCHPMHMLTWE